MLKRCTLFSLLFFVVILIGCKKDIDENVSSIETERGIPVTAIQAKRSDFYDYGVYYGRTQGVKRASINNITGGTVESVDVLEGAAVVKGDSLAKISSRSATIALESARLNEKINKENYLTLKKFLKSGNSTQLKVDQAQLTWLNSQSQLIDAEKSYNAAFCISPIDGTVVSRTINIKDEVFPGQTTFLIEDLSEIEIKIGISEGDMKGVIEGAVAEISMDLYPEKVWTGRLIRYARRSSDQNLTFDGFIRLDNCDGRILSGTTVKVRLLRDRYIDAIVIPADVVRDNKHSSYVMVVKGDRVCQQEVVIAATSVESVVVSKGISSGDMLVREGLSLLVDGQLVDILKEEA